MWDKRIREKISREYKTMGKKGIGDNGTGYYRFMIIVQELLHRKRELWYELSKNLKTTKLKIIDIYFWNIANKHNNLVF